MAVIKNDRDIALQATVPRLIATSVAISADGALFTKLKNGGGYTPANITLTANTTVFTSPTHTWHYALNTSPETWVSLGTGSPKVITSTDFVTAIGYSGATSVQYRVVTTQAGYREASNYFSITYSKEADEPIEVFISKNTAIVPADALGVPTSYDNTGTVITVRRGSTYLNYNASSGNNTFYILSTSINPPGKLTLGTLTGAGTTATYANITDMDDATDVVEVTYTVRVRDASGVVVTPDSTVVQTFNKISSGTGTDGEDAYHIRVDNESRIILCDQNGTPKSGTLPVTAYMYVTKGATDVTVGSGYITYSVESTSGATGASVNSSGVVTVTGITADTNYVEIKAVIAEPSMPVLNAYKKLYIHKLKEGAMSVDINLTQDNAVYAYANSTSTVTTSTHTVINFVATVSGITPEPSVTWSTKAYNSSGTEIGSGENQLTISGNNATMSPTQFGARGNPATRMVRVTVKFYTGIATIEDSVLVYRLDGTGDYALDVTENPHFAYMADVGGEVGASEYDKETCTVKVFDMNTWTHVTTGWSFTASVTGGCTLDISGTGAGPFVSVTGNDVIIKLTDIPVGVLDGEISITATKSGFPTTIGKISFTVNVPVSSGYTVYFEPKTEILLYKDPVTGTILSYEEAFTYIKVLKGGIDDTANWTFTKVDGPGVTSTLTS